MSKSKFCASGMSIGPLWFEVRMCTVDGSGPNALAVVTIRKQHYAGDVLWRGMADDLKPADLERFAQALRTAGAAVKDANAPKAEPAPEPA